MDDFDTFDSWQAYSSFVGDAQRSLFREFVEDADREAFESDSPSRIVTSFARPMERDWLDRIRRKWGGERGAVPGMEVYEYMYRETCDPTPRNRTEAAAETFSGEELSLWLQEIERTGGGEPVYERERTDPVAEYLEHAPEWALQIEAWLDGLAGFVCAAATADRDRLEAVYESASAGVDSNQALDRVLRTEVFDRYDRETFVSGDFVEPFVDRLDRYYRRLHELTVFASTPADRTLAIGDEALPEGRGHPRTWEVRPEPAVASVEGAIPSPADPVAPEDVRATVTVDRTETFDAPLSHRVEGFFGGVVDEADDDFPVDPGEKVLVSPANVVRSVDHADAAGFSPHQRAVLTTARETPEDLGTESIDEIVEWIETAPPDVREAFVSALGPAIPDLGAADRVRTALVDAVDDPTESVRHAAIRALARAASTDPATVTASLTTVVDRLEDGDDVVRTHAAEICARVAATDPEPLGDHLGAIVAALDDVPREAPSDDTRSAAEWTTRTCERVHAAAVDLPADAFDPLVGLAGDGSTAALRTLATVDPETPAFEAALDGVESRLLPLLDEHHTIRKVAATGLNRIAAVNAPLLLATDERELFLELVRGTRNQRESGLAPVTSYRIAALLGALYAVSPEYVGGGDLIDALVEGTGRETILAAHAVVLGHVGYRHPVLVEDAIEPLVRTVRDPPSSNNRDRAVRVLRDLGAADPTLLDESVVDELRDVAESSDVSTTSDAAVQALAVAGDPVLTEDAWESVAKGRRYGQPVSRLAAVEAVGSILAADRSFGVERGVFGWLAAVVTRDDDPRVIALALDVLTDYWVADRSFVERECIPLDHDAIERRDDGRFEVRDVGDRVSFVRERRDAVPERAGIDPVVWAVKGLQETPTPPRIRVGELLDYFASVRNDDSTADFDDLTAIAEEYHGPPTDGERDALPTDEEYDAPSTDGERDAPPTDGKPIRTPGHDELVSVLERQAAGRPDRVATVVGDQLCDVSADADPLEYRELALVLARVGSAADDVGATVADALADDLRADSALVRLTAGATIVALGDASGEKRRERAASVVREARSSDVADVAESMLGDLAGVSTGIRDRFPDAVPTDR